MRKITLTGALLLCISLVNAQDVTKAMLADDASVPRDHALDIIRLKLELSFDAPGGLIKGKVTHYFTPIRPAVDSFFLDGIRMDVKEVILNGKPVHYHADSTGITIIPANALLWNIQDSLVISYEARPRKGLYFIGWNDKNNLSRKQIWSQGEGIDNRNWIPMYDERNDKLISELIITFDKDFKVLSNGDLTERHDNADGTITWHYAMQHPHAPYLIMLGIGKYEIRETHAASGIPMHLYYYPEWKDRVNPTYKFSEAMMDYFEKEIGVPYPWGSYAQIPVQDYMFGAMENTTATVFGDFLMVDTRAVLDRNYIGVNAHELAHQWFGDDVTALDDAHVWLQEGFATYYNQLFEREVFGDDYFNWARRGAQNASLEESKKNWFGVAHSEAGGSRIYGKGAFVLNMLKYVVGGREAFNKAIKYYLQQHAYENVDSHDLLIAFEHSTGMQLDWFWDEWLYRGGEPSYSIGLSSGNDESELVIKQVQELSNVSGYSNGLFKMPVWIEVHYTDGSFGKKQYWIQEQTEIIHLPNPENKKIDFVLFDTGNEIMKQVGFIKPFRSLAAQVLKAPNMLDRYDALVGMKGIDVSQKREVLINVYHHEKFFAVKSEVISQLAGDDDPQSIQLFREAVADTDAAVRKSVLKNIDPIAKGLLHEFEKLLTDSSYEIVETCLQKLCISNPAKMGYYLSVTKNTEGNVGKNVSIKWLEISYMTSAKKAYADRLVDLTSSSYEFRTRANAMAALKRLSYYNTELLADAIDALMSPNARLSAPAADLLKFFYSQDRFKNIIDSYIKSRQWLPWQGKILQINGL